MGLTEQLAMVLFVFALLGGLVWFAKRRGTATLLPRRGRGRSLEVMERVQLTPHHAVHLVRVSGKLMLIGTAPSACMLLDTPVPSDTTFSVERDQFSKT